MKHSALRWSNRESSNHHKWYHALFPLTELICARSSWFMYNYIPWWLWWTSALSFYLLCLLFGHGSYIDGLLTSRFTASALSLEPTEVDFLDSFCLQLFSLRCAHRDSWKSWLDNHRSKVPLSSLATNSNPRPTHPNSHFVLQAQISNKGVTKSGEKMRFE